MSGSRALVPTPNGLRRKLAIATWSPPREGNIYGKLTVDVTEALRWIEAVRAQSGEKVTLTHLVGKAVAEAFAQAPGLNGVIRLGTYQRHSGVALSFLIALDEGQNLAKAKIDDFDKKSVVDVARELRERAARLAAGKDEAFNKSMGPLSWMPTWLIRPVVAVSGYLTGVLGISVPALGLEAFPFGACVITNVGVFGLDEGFAPPTPFAHAPVYVLMGAVKQAPHVVEGQVVARPLLTLCATIDHRYMDGAQGGVLAKVVRGVLEDPWSLPGSPPRPAA
jgi:pyruvate dehydrogenase E2 component (dihydrolipoamide acetyltransferase)